MILTTIKVIMGRRLPDEVVHGLRIRIEAGEAVLPILEAVKVAKKTIYKIRLHLDIWGEQATVWHDATGSQTIHRHAPPRCRFVLLVLKKPKSGIARAGSGPRRGWKRWQRSVGYKRNSIGSKIASGPLFLAAGAQ